jgi:hypothetical protein
VIASLACEVLNTFDCLRAVFSGLDDDVETSLELFRIVSALE